MIKMVTPEEMREALDDITMRTLGEAWDERMDTARLRRLHRTRVKNYLEQAGFEVPDDTVDHYCDLIYGHNGGQQTGELTMDLAGVYERRSEQPTTINCIVEVVFPKPNRN